MACTQLRGRSCHRDSSSIRCNICMQYGNAGPIIDVGLLHRTHGLVDCCKQIDVPKTQAMVARIAEDAESTVEGSSLAGSRSSSLASDLVDVPRERRDLETTAICRGALLVEPPPQSEVLDASVFATHAEAFATGAVEALMPAVEPLMPAMEAFATHAEDLATKVLSSFDSATNNAEDLATNVRASFDRATNGAEDLATNVLASFDFLANCSSQRGGDKPRRPRPGMTEVKKTRFSTGQTTMSTVSPEWMPQTPCAPHTPSTKKVFLSEEEVALFSDACTPTVMGEGEFFHNMFFLEDELGEGVDASALAAIALEECELQLPPEPRPTVSKSNCPDFPNGWGRRRGLQSI